MLNTTIIMGRLTADPELKTTSNNVSVVSFTVAVDRDYQKDGDRQTDFINVVAWRKTAEFIAKYFKKGSMIALEGSLQTRNYEDRSGNKRTATEVVVRNASFCGTGKPKNDVAPAASAAPVAPAAPAAPVAPVAPEPEIDDDDDLPF